MTLLLLETFMAERCGCVDHPAIVFCTDNDFCLWQQRTLLLMSTVDLSSKGRSSIPTVDQKTGDFPSADIMYKAERAWSASWWQLCDFGLLVSFLFFLLTFENIYIDLLVTSADLVEMQPFFSLCVKVFLCLWNDAGTCLKLRQYLEVRLIQQSLISLAAMQRTLRRKKRVLRRERLVGHFVCVCGLLGLDVFWRGEEVLWDVPFSDLSPCG